MAKTDEKTISVRVSVDMYKRIKALAFYHDVSLNELMITALDTLMTKESAAAIDKLTPMLGAGTADTTSNIPIQSPAPPASKVDKSTAPEDIGSRLAQMKPLDITVEFVNAAEPPKDESVVVAGTPIPEAEKKSPRENAVDPENLKGSAVETYSATMTAAAGVIVNG